jgi:outer membrane protein assembly factor BamB
MGLVARSDKLAMLLELGNRQRSLQILDPKTGKLQRQATIKIPNLETTRDTIATNDRTVFLETSELLPGDKPNEFRSGNTQTLTGYDSKTLQPRFRKDIKGGSILQMEPIPQSGGFANGNILILEHDIEIGLSTEDGKTFLAIDANTGRLLWRKTGSQLNCFGRAMRRYRADADNVYFDCGRATLSSYKDSRVVALSIKTGSIRWQTKLSAPSGEDDSPTAMNERQYITFGNVSKTDTRQIQAVALDRQTGKLLWVFPLFDNNMQFRFRDIVAADGDRFFTLDVLSRWQLWLLQMNINWYAKQPIAN